MKRLLLFSALLALAACGGSADLTVAEGTGPTPTIPEPSGGLIPTINFATAVGWPGGKTPEAIAGAEVQAFASGLDHPRWMHVLPNGDVLVAETNKPPNPDPPGGIKAIVQKSLMENAGALAPSANRITLLRDTDGDGVADVRTPFLTGLSSPFGMQLVGEDLYVAFYNALVRFPYTPGATTLVGTPGETVLELPNMLGARHWTKSLLASPDGSKLYIGVGSASNVGEMGLAAENGRAAVWEYDVASGEGRVYASGLRNPVGLAWEPTTGALWTAVNERDELGSDVPPDYMTRVRDGDFYGWPWLYYGDVVDTRAPGAPPQPTALKPDYALGPHTASLGLAWGADALGLGEGMFVGQHGSWNRKPASGYKVIFVPFANGMPSGQPTDVLTGFRVGDDARGRPVGVEIAKDGALLVADDVGNIIWRVSSPYDAAR
ncbi:sorbosone dehydrogenase [Rubricoccus marinus]|uniref:Sorbosone dehydrogenase n=2 Tax=Rubricoccus marinus TaxID=716817 RepID=A0A259TX76_9BACT|nr:sorbosone dehydrogenase family protein [Rubricoccus marinus]OZC02174.1 sorbosone dehydrogenase [Rubricoccus marinus]